MAFLRAVISVVIFILISPYLANCQLLQIAGSAKVHATELPWVGNGINNAPALTSMGPSKETLATQSTTPDVFAKTITPRKAGAVDNIIERNAIDPIVKSAANWAGNMYTYTAVSREFDNGSPGGEDASIDGPLNSFMTYAVNNNSAGAVVSSMSMCRVYTGTSRQCFGGNDVVQARKGAVSPVLIGREIDIQTESPSVNPASISAGLYINFFTSNFGSSPGILVNALNGASYNVGLQVAAATGSMNYGIIIGPGIVNIAQIRGLNFSIDPKGNVLTSGFFTSSGYSNIGNQQGSYMTWNKTGGLGETDFINHHADATGGFNFSTTPDGKTFTTVLSIGPTGGITAPLLGAGLTAAGSICIDANGNLFRKTAAGPCL